jgi:hypothetical protein
MANFQPNEKRRADIKAALKRAKPKDESTMAELAIVWGTEKQRLVTNKKEMPTWPDSVRKVGNELFFPTKAALEAMLAYETRFDSVMKDRAARRARMVEGTKPKADTMTSALPLQDLIQANRLSAEIEQREDAQRARIPFAEVQRIAGTIFGRLSTFIADIGSTIDPNGQLPNEMRTRLDERGREALLELHADIKGLLSNDGDGNATPGNGRQAGKPGRRKSLRKSR